MTSDGSSDGPSSTTVAPPVRDQGPYVLRALLDEVPLSQDGTQGDIKINCVDHWGIICALQILWLECMDH